MANWTIGGVIEAAQRELEFFEKRYHECADENKSTEYYAGMIAATESMLERLDTVEVSK